MPYVTAPDSTFALPVSQREAVRFSVAARVLSLAGITVTGFDRALLLLVVVLIIGLIVG